jgi:hypothetical protein
LPRAALRWHGRTARRGRVVAHVSRWLVAGDQLLDFARQRLIFKQPFG